MSLWVCVLTFQTCKDCAVIMRVRAHIAILRGCAPPICRTFYLYIIVPHAATEWLSRGATGPCLIISWSSPLVLPNMRQSTYLHIEHIFVLPLLHVDGSSMHADSHANTIPQQGYTPLRPTPPAVSDGNTLESKLCVYCCSKINLKTYLLFLGSCSFGILFIQTTYSSLEPKDVTK